MLHKVRGITPLLIMHTDNVQATGYHTKRPKLLLLPSAGIFDMLSRRSLARTSQASVCRPTPSISVPCRSILRSPSTAPFKPNVSVNWRSKQYPVHPLAHPVHALLRHLRFVQSFARSCPDHTKRLIQRVVPQQTRVLKTSTSFLLRRHRRLPSPIHGHQLTHHALHHPRSPSPIHGHQQAPLARHLLKVHLARVERP